MIQYTKMLTVASIVMAATCCCGDLYAQGSNGSCEEKSPGIVGSVIGRVFDNIQERREDRQERVHARRSARMAARQERNDCPGCTTSPKSARQENSGVSLESRFLASERDYLHSILASR